MRARQPRTGAWSLSDSVCPDVFLLKIIPGTRPEIFDSIVSMGYRGIVIEAFGVGGMHFLYRNLIGKLDMLCEQGISVLIISQCMYDSIDLDLYEAGSKLPVCVMSGRDMTTEAAVTKLMWALGQSGDPATVQAIMDTCYCGEFEEQDN